MDKIFAASLPILASQAEAKLICKFWVTNKQVLQDGFWK